MRVSQLRGALLCARQYVSVAASACTLGLLLSACGGNDSASTSSNANLPVTISGADGASVSLRALPREAASQATVRVARDGTGAPLLGESYTPLGAVYQFTPLGWIEEAIEIRVPFAHSEAGDAPHLLIAQPGGDWTEVANARVEGHFMVARVPQLAYATVAASSTSTSTSDRVWALGARITGTSSSGPLALGFDAEATTPTLPVPDSDGIVTVVSPTSLGLKLQYALPSGCKVAPVVSVEAVVWNPLTKKLKAVALGSRSVAGNTGGAAYIQPLSPSDNGTWVFASLAYCKEPGRLLPRYAVLSAGPGLIVNIGTTTPTPLPAITSAPLDASVVEGTTASFSVTATGDALSYEWQRSNDGGATYAPAGAANAPSYSLTTALADNNALFRVKVSNANGSTTSTSAKLTVSQKVIAPAVTSDPANQTVLEGETASFSVAGTGQPAPAIQWQQRPAANADAEAGWADVTGATGSTYTTAALDLSQNGAQYRALLRNAGGVAATLPATLAVNARVVAPAIVTAPQSLSVAAGQFGLFSVTASGSTPLSYQWLKNGQAIAGANATEVLILADPADAGGSYSISVHVSNTAGTVTSQAATLSVGTVGTPVSAANGGTVAAADGSSLSIPAGALPSDTTVSVTNEAVDPASLPANVLGLSDIIEIRPPGLQFSSPVELTFKVSTEIPAGMTIAIIDVAPSASTATAQGRVSVQSAKSATRNLRRSAASGVKTLATQATISNIFVPNGLSCGNVQNINSDGTYKFAGIVSAIRKMAVAVPISACSIVEEIVPTEVPIDSDQPCTSSSQFSSVSSEAGLVNRHIQCLSALVTNQIIEADLELVSTHPETGAKTWKLVKDAKASTGIVSTFQMGIADVETEFSISGPSNRLGKRIEIRQRLVNFKPAKQDPINSGPFSPSSIKTKPVIECDAGTSNSATCTFTTPTLTVPLNGSWSDAARFDIQFNWAKGTDQLLDMESIQVFAQRYGYAVDGSDFARTQNNAEFGFLSNMNSPSPLRCDRGVAQANTEGCVFPQAAAVYVLSRADGTVKEAAEHILEAQTGPLQAPGKFLLRPGTRALADSSVTGAAALQRAKSLTVQEENRKQSCSLATSLYKTRLPLNQSATCAEGTQRCSCDEYPFASTWSGGRFNPDRTSAKNINFEHNLKAGSARLTNFYLAERVLDFTQYPEQVQPYDPNAESNRGGDDFWVYVK